MCIVHIGLHKKFQHGLVWYYSGFDKPPSRDTVDRFSPTSNAIDEIFNRLVKKAAARGLFDPTYSVNSTHIGAIQYNNAAL